MLRTQYGVHNLQWLLNDENIGAEIKRHIQVLVEFVTESLEDPS